jgi:putative flippase GtrA
MQKTAKLNIIMTEYACSLFDKYKHIMRFAIVGFINTGVDFLVFTAMHNVAGLDKMFCQVAGYGMGIANSFIMNKLWTFESSKPSIGTINQIVRFIAINLFSLGITLYGLHYLNDILGINIYISKVLVTMIAQVINYLGYKLLVFKGS